MKPEEPLRRRDTEGFLDHLSASMLQEMLWLKLAMLSVDGGEAVLQDRDKTFTRQ